MLLIVPGERELPDVWTRRGWPGVGGRDTTEAGWRPTGFPGFQDGWASILKDSRDSVSRAATRREACRSGAGFRAAAGCWGWGCQDTRPPGGATSFSFLNSDSRPLVLPHSPGTFYEQQGRQESAVFGISVLKPHLSGSPCAQGQLHELNRGRITKVRAPLSPAPTRAHTCPPRTTGRAFDFTHLLSPPSCLSHPSDLCIIHHF